MSDAVKPLWNRFTYFPHQITGIDWMLEKERIGTEVSLRNKEGTTCVKGGFQCDDMGLGKTIQMTAVMVNHVVKKTLLIAPLAMIDTWSAICKRSGMAVYEVDKKKKGTWTLQNRKSPIPMRLMKHRPTIYISNYEKLYTTTSLFRESWDRVVLDEAHKIRNANSIIAYFARKVKAPLRWVITGTPLVNSLKDVVSLLAFLSVPTSAMFSWEKRYTTILPQILIHRSLDSLRTDIQGAPPVPEIHHRMLPFTTTAEEEFYHGVQCTSTSAALKYGADRINASNPLLLLLRLRQISVHPQVYINSKRREYPHYPRPDWVGPSTKLEAVKSILTSETDQLHKYIIFCQFNDEMKLIHEYLLQEKLVKDENILMYNGQMNQEERRVVLETSKATQETTVLLIQLQAGGVGLNLQEYDRVLFISPWWTSAMMDQAVARAVRMGQTKVVKVYHLHLQAEQENTINIDEVVNTKAEEKRKMLEKLFALCVQ